MRVPNFVNAISIILLFENVKAFGLISQIKKTVKAVRMLGKVRSLLQNGVEIFDDVHLPKSVGFTERLNSFFDIQSSSILRQEGFALAKLFPESAQEYIEDDLSVVNYDVLIGSPRPTKDTMTKPRARAFLQLYTEVIHRLIETGIDSYDVMPCEGYLYFGNKDYTKILPKLCQCNPFFANALTVSGDNDEFLELNAQDDSRYATVVKAMNDRIKSKYINVRFNKDMTINEIVNYKTGRPVIVPKEEWNYYASGACYSVYYHAQCVHALIHVLHHLMTTGITVSTRHDDSLNAWAELYDANIVLKYVEVAALLYPSNLPVPAEGKILTGDKGIGGSTKVMDEMRQLLCEWGSFKTADDFKKKFLLKGIYDTAKNPDQVIESSEILTEFRKHMDNVEPFATDLTEAMRTANPANFDKAEKELTEFMSECGKGVSSIDSISSWVQLMSCTGIFHGSTLSTTRLGLMPEFLMWNEFDKTKFTEEDKLVVATVTATMGGMSPGRNVFTSKATIGTKWKTDKISSNVMDVLKKYDAKATELKTKYQEEIEQGEDFREFGWILTDHCPDGFDGKQHTLTTYI